MKLYLNSIFIIRGYRSYSCSCIGMGYAPATHNLSNGIPVITMFIFEQKPSLVFSLSEKMHTPHTTDGVSSLRKRLTESQDYLWSFVTLLITMFCENVYQYWNLEFCFMDNKKLIAFLSWWPSVTMEYNVCFEDSFEILAA